MGSPDGPRAVPASKTLGAPPASSSAASLVAAENVGRKDVTLPSEPAKAGSPKSPQARFPHTNGAAEPRSRSDRATVPPLRRPLQHAGGDVGLIEGIMPPKAGEAFEV